MNLSGILIKTSGAFSIQELAAKDANVPQLDNGTKYIQCDTGGAFKVFYNGSTSVDAVIDYYNGYVWSRREDTLANLIVDNSWLSQSGDYTTFTLTAGEAIATLIIKSGSDPNLVRNPIGPVQMAVDYTTEQLSFKFKLPSTSTITINWGDGTTEDVVGQDDVIITKTSSYSSAGIYNFYVTRAVHDLTYIKVTQEFVSGDISRYAELSNLAFLNLSDSSFYGSVDSFAGLTGMTTFNISQTSISGDLSVLSSMPNIILRAYRCPLLTWDTDADFGVQDGAWQRVYANDFTAEMVDNCIKSFQNYTNSEIELWNTGKRTSASDVALLKLINAGTTVYFGETDSLGSLGSELYTLSNAISIGSEADSVAGWTGTGFGGGNVFQSQSSEKSDGSYAFEMDLTNNPTAGGNVTLDTPMTIENNEIYRVSMDFKQKLTTYTWGFFFENILKNYFHPAFTEWQQSVFYVKSSGVSAIIKFQEQNGLNSGGMYIDKFSVKKVTP